MNKNLPNFIDPLKLARSQTNLTAGIAQIDLTRFCETLLRCEQTVDVDVEFSLNALGTILIEGQLSTLIYLDCQRCFQPMSWALDSQFSLGLVKTEEEAENLASHIDVLYLQELHAEHQNPTEISLWALIEDELILSLPLIALHEPAECGAWTRVESYLNQEEEPVKRHPFAMLEELK